MRNIGGICREGERGGSVLVNGAGERAERLFDEAAGRQLQPGGVKAEGHPFVN